MPKKSRREQVVDGIMTVQSVHSKLTKSKKKEKKMNNKYLTKISEDLEKQAFSIIKNPIVQAGGRFIKNLLGPAPARNTVVEVGVHPVNHFEQGLAKIKAFGGGAVPKIDPTNVNPVAKTVRSVMPEGSIDGKKLNLTGNNLRTGKPLKRDPNAEIRTNIDAAVTKGRSQLESGEKSKRSFGEKFIRKNPYLAIGGAAAVGVGGGMLLNNRRDGNGQ